MIRFGVLYIYGIFYVAAVDLRFFKHEGNDRSVNLALDTVVEFDNKDNGADIQFLDNMQKLIGKVKKVIVKKNSRRNFNSINNKKLTDFILSLIQILIKFKDTDLEDFFSVTNNEMRKYHYKGCKFYELIESYDFRKFLATKLDEIKNTPADITRRKLTAVANKIQEETYTLKEKELIDYINSLYGQSSIELFNNILGSLDDYRVKAKQNMNLSKIISKGIRSTLFDYYTKLNRNARMALKTKLDEFFERTIGISTFATKSLVESIKSIITTKESTSKPKYVEQYLDLRNHAFKYSRGNPSLSTLSVTFDSKRNNNIPSYNSKLLGQKIENNADIVESGEKPKTPNFKPKKGPKTFTQPYFEKETKRKNDPFFNEHSKIDKKIRRQTYKTIHPVRWSTVDKHDKSQRLKLKKYRKPKIHMNPKEPEIESNNFKSNEFTTLDHEITTSTQNDDSSIDEKLLKVEKEHIKHKYSKHSKVSPNPDNPKHSIDLKINRNLDQPLNNGKDKFETSHKLSKGYDIEKSYSDDKLDSNIVRNQVDKLRTIDELQINPNIDRIPKSQKSKEKTSSKTTEPDSIEIIAFDDSQGIEKYSNINHKSEEKLNLLNNKVTVKRALEKKLDKVTKTKRIKTNKLTFMTLYPEFIQKWSTANSQVENKQRNDSINLKQTPKFKSRNIQTTPRGKKTTNVKYSKRAKNIELSFRTPNGHFQNPTWKRKEMTKKYLIKPEINEAKHIRHLIAREKLKGFRNPSVVLSGVKNKRRNDLSSDLVNSEENISTKEFTDEMNTKIPYGQSINNNRRDFFIDLNIPKSQPSPGKKITLINNEIKYDTNMNKFINGKHQQLKKNNNDVNNEELQEKPLTSDKSSDSKEDTYVYNYKKTSKNLVLQKTQDINDAKKEKYTTKNDIKLINLNLNISKSKIYGAGNKFKKYADPNFQFDKNKYNENLTRRVFIDLQNTEENKSGVVGINIKGNNSSVKKSLTRSNRNNMLDGKEDTKRKIKEKETQTNTSSGIDKKLNKVDFSQIDREPYDNHKNTLKRKKIYFSYVNHEVNNNGFNLFHNDKENITKGSNKDSSTIKNVIDNNKYTEFVSITRDSEKVTKFLQSRSKDKNSVKEISNTGHKNVINRLKIMNQTKDVIKTNKLSSNITKKDNRNNLFINNIDNREKNTEKLKVNEINDPGLKNETGKKKSYTNTFIQNMKESSLQTKEDSIEIPYKISIDDGKFRTENDTNKLKEIEQGLVPTKLNDINLNIQRRAPLSIKFNDANNNTPNFTGRHKTMASYIKSSTMLSSEATTITRRMTDKIPLLITNADTEKTTAYLKKITKSHVKDINDITKSSNPKTKITITNTHKIQNLDGQKVDELKQVTGVTHLDSNMKHVNHITNVTSKLDDYVKAIKTTSKDFNVTDNRVGKVI